MTGLPLLDWSPPAQRQSWQDRAPTACTMLRELLSDGRWHHMDQLRDAAGWRYGARLHECKRGADGLPPLEFEKRIEGSNREVSYRLKPVSP